MWDGHSCPSLLTLGLKLGQIPTLKKPARSSIIHNRNKDQHQDQRRQTGVSVPHLAGFISSAKRADPLLSFLLARRHRACRELWAKYRAGIRSVSVRTVSRFPIPR